MRRGFTLVEILTALTIVVVLAALLFPVIAGARKKAFEPADISNMKQLYTAFVMYEEDSGVGPMSTMLPFRAYTGDERIYASARDTYRKAYPDGTWPGRVFIPCGPERSPF